jgi:hypothetical protein
VYHDHFRTRRLQRQEIVPYVLQPAPVATYAPAAKDPGAGLLIELVPGFFGFLGIGYLWAGETAIGLALLIGYWSFWAIVGVLTVLTLGLLLCFLPFFILLFLVAPLISALALQNRLRLRQVQQMQLVYAQQPY